MHAVRFGALTFPPRPARKRSSWRRPFPGCRRCERWSRMPSATHLS